MSKTIVIDASVSLRFILKEQLDISSSDILEITLELFEITPLAKDTLSLVLHYQLVYDAAYAALAKQKHCKFYTGDTNLYEKVKGRLKFVKPISDY